MGIYRLEKTQNILEYCIYAKLLCIIIIKISLKLKLLHNKNFNCIENRNYKNSKIKNNYASQIENGLMKIYM